MPQDERKAQSHDIAKRVRPGLQPIADALRRAHQGGRGAARAAGAADAGRRGLRARLHGSRSSVARQVKQHLQEHTGRGRRGLVRRGPQTEVRLRGRPRQGGAARHLRRRGHAAPLQIALDGAERRAAASPEGPRGRAHRGAPAARRTRSGIERPAQHQVAHAVGRAWSPLGEVTHVEQTTIDTSIYHKNLQRVVYVTGDVAGEEESPVYAILKMKRAIDQPAAARRLRHRAVLRAPACLTAPSATP